mmetsp:Transcript_51437/g.165924  ORF Transcript_51437/g.165924 Transcript_51437/m.165924 type:complete len:384 (+) Transcript_51437:129-1280(+)
MEASIEAINDRVLLEGDPLEAVIALLPIGTVLAVRRVARAWRLAARNVLSSSAWQAAVPCDVLLEHRAPSRAIATRLRAAPSEAAEPDAAGRLLLHVALQRRASEATVRAIVQANAAAPRTWGPGRLLPLHVAAVAGASAGVCSALLEAHPAAARSAGKGARLPLHCAAANHAAPLDLLQRLLEADTTSAAARTHDGSTPLHLAAASARASVHAVKLLLQSAPQSAAAPRKDGKLPLHLAALHASPTAVVRALLSALPAAASTEDRTFSLPLHYASHGDSGQAGAGGGEARRAGGRVPAVAALLSEAHPPRGDGSWTLPQLLRLGAAGEEAALSLIAREPSAAQQDEHTGSFPFHLAVFHHASQPVLDALLAAAPGAATVKFS